MMERKNNKIMGFSLIELAVVLVIIGILGGAGLSMLASSTETAQYTATKNKMTEIMSALHRFYAANGRLPCPASGAKTLGDSGYGTEIYSGLCDRVITPANTAAPAGTVVTEVVAASGNWVRQGTLPSRALGLSDQMMYDDYGSKFTYIVTERFTTRAVDGVITIDDGLGHDIVGGTSTHPFAAVALISHGKDRKGAYTAFSTIGIACNSVGYDKENCNSDANDVILTDTQYNDLAAASWFDDLIKWEDKNTIIGLTSSSTGTLSIKFTAANYTGNLGGVSGANDKCHAEYPGHHICNKVTDMMAYGATGSIPSSKSYFAGNYGSWIDGGATNCTAWTSNATTSDVIYVWGTTIGVTCGITRPISCCKSN